MQYLEAAKSLARTLSLESSRRDAERVLPLQEFKIVKESKIHGARIAAEFGGGDVSFGELAEIFVELASGDPNVAQALQPHFFLVECIRLKGTKEQQASFSRLIVGGVLTANAYAERGTGAVGSTSTTLKRSSSGLTLKGVKYYSTGSLFAEYLYATAVNDAGELCLVIFPRDREGVTVVDDWDGMGQRTTASGTTRLEDVSVEEQEVIPVPEFNGQRVYIGSASQIVHAAIDVGIAKAALSDAIAYAPKSRPVPESGVERSTDDPYILHSVGEMAVAVHSAEAMLARAGAYVDRAAAAQLQGSSSRADLERIVAEASIAVAEAKATANETSLKVSDMMFRVGGAGMTARKYNFDRHWRNARTHTTHDPVAYKYRAVGDYLLNSRFPPLSTKI